MSNTQHARKQKIKRHLVKADLESIVALYKTLIGRDATPEEIARMARRLHTQRKQQQ
jgi:hypothetical protein